MIHDDGHLQDLLSEPSHPDMNGRDEVDSRQSPIAARDATLNDWVWVGRETVRFVTDFQES
jgi:hypothetical protein